VEHVDDFLIHAPTSQNVSRLTILWIPLFDWGLYVRRSRPASSSVSSVSFVRYFRTAHTSHPRGLSRAEATLSYLNALGNRPLSRLALAVVVGLLQSLVDAAPQRIGQTYLRRVYDDLHALQTRTGRLAVACITP
jgi:hypothetical protein